MQERKRRDEHRRNSSMHMITSIHKYITFSAVNVVMKTILSCVRECFQTRHIKFELGACCAERQQLRVRYNWPTKISTPSFQKRLEDCEHSSRFPSIETVFALNGQTCTPSLTLTSVELRLAELEKLLDLPEGVRVIVNLRGAHVRDGPVQELADDVPGDRVDGLAVLVGEALEALLLRLGDLVVANCLELVMQSRHRRDELRRAVPLLELGPTGYVVQCGEIGRAHV